MQKNFQKLYQMPPLSETMDLNEEDIVPVWESQRAYYEVNVQRYLGLSVSLYEDEATGLVTADPKKFEQFMDNLREGLTF